MRNLAIVGLKLLGILGIYWGITGMAQIALVLIPAFSPGNLRVANARTFAAFWSMSPIICFSILTIGFAFILLAGTDRVVAMFNFPEDPPSSGMEPSQLLHVGFVLVGAYCVLGALPAIGSAAYVIIEYRTGTHQASAPGLERIIEPALKFILGCIVIGKSDRFAKSVFPPAGPV